MTVGGFARSVQQASGASISLREIIVLLPYTYREWRRRKWMTMKDSNWNDVSLPFPTDRGR
jgi:hypothetical protein